MKAIVLSHAAGGSYLLDKSGSFQFAKSFTHLPIGTEVELKAKPCEGRLAKYVGIAACAALAVLAACVIAKRKP